MRSYRRQSVVWVGFDYSGGIGKRQPGGIADTKLEGFD